MKKIPKARIVSARIGAFEAGCLLSTAELSELAAMLDRWSPAAEILFVRLAVIRRLLAEDVHRKARILRSLSR